MHRIPLATMLLASIFSVHLVGATGRDAAQGSQATVVEVTVTDKVMSSKPASPLLFSSFLELAFGRSDLISAELLLDRGFEMPEGASLNNGNGWCERSKPRLEMEDWWHSGYEEHPWYLAKSATNTMASMTRTGGIWPSAPNGRFYLRAENKSPTESVCIAQDGIWVNSGMAYQFSGLMCDGTMFSAKPDSARPVPIEICLFPEGKLEEAPLSSTKILVDSTTWGRFAKTSSKA